VTYSDDCVNLVKESEGFKAHPYKDSAGFGTVGYGHKILPGEDFADGVTIDEAERILTEDMDQALRGVESLVKVSLTQGQVDALVDFVFNEGAGRLATSTLLRKLNAGYVNEVPAELARWNLAGGKVLPGLVIRRQKEIELWGKEIQ